MVRSSSSRWPLTPASPSSSDSSSMVIMEEWGTGEVDLLWSSWGERPKKEDRPLEGELGREDLIGRTLLKYPFLGDGGGGGG